MPRHTLKLGAVLIGVGGPGQHNTWLYPEIAEIVTFLGSLRGQPPLGPIVSVRSSAW